MCRPGVSAGRCSDHIQSQGWSSMRMLPPAIGVPILIPVPQIRTRAPGSPRVATGVNAVLHSGTGNNGESIACPPAATGHRAGPHSGMHQGDSVYRVEQSPPAITLVLISATPTCGRPSNRTSCHRITTGLHSGSYRLPQLRPFASSCHRRLRRSSFRRREPDRGGRAHHVPTSIHADLSGSMLEPHESSDAISPPPSSPILIQVSQSWSRAITNSRRHQCP